jgi:hypothetical protein
VVEGVDSVVAMEQSAEITRALALPFNDTFHSLASLTVLTVELVTRVLEGV